MEHMTLIWNFINSAVGRFVVTFAGGFIVGLITDAVIRKMVDDKNERRENILRGCFGDPMYAVSFELREVRDWINLHRDMLREGCKAVIFKLNDKTMSMLVNECNINFDKVKYIVTAIVGKNETDIRASLLVKYEKLDAKLEELLAPGKGVVVVEG